MWIADVLLLWLLILVWVLEVVVVAAVVGGGIACELSSEIRASCEGRQSKWLVEIAARTAPGSSARADPR